MGIKIKVISTFCFSSRERIISIIEIKKKKKRYRTVFYRSSGSNSNKKGAWFPCAGIIADNALYSPPGESFGYIIKDLIVASFYGMKKYPAVATSEAEHYDSDFRIKSFELYQEVLPFSVREVSEKLSKMWKKDPFPISLKVSSVSGTARVGVINTMIRESFLELTPLSLDLQSRRRPNIAIEEALYISQDIRKSWKKGKALVSSDILDDLVFLLSGKRGSEKDSVPYIDDSIEKVVVCPSCKLDEVTKIENIPLPRGVEKYRCLKCDFVWKTEEK